MAENGPTMVYCFLGTNLTFNQTETYTAALNNNIFKEILAHLNQFVKKKKMLSRETRKELLYLQVPHDLCKEATGGKAVPGHQALFIKGMFWW